MTKKVKFFLVVNESGSIRTTKGRPSLHSDEISIGIQLNIPDALFKRPQLEATLTIDEGAVAQPSLSVEAIDTVRAAIEQGTGMEVVLRFAEDAST